MNIEFDGKIYQITRGSVVTTGENGLSIKLCDTSDRKVRSDVDGTEIFFSEKVKLPFELIRFLVKTADEWFMND